MRDGTALSTDQAADHLAGWGIRVSTSTVRRWAQSQSGDPLPSVVVAGHYRYSASAVDKWIVRRTG